MLRVSSITVIFVFLLMTGIGCSSITKENKRSYDYQCYKYYDSRVESEPDKEFCKKCLCIDTSKIRLW